jgi:hypothetical protein
MIFFLSKFRFAPRTLIFGLKSSFGPSKKQIKEKISVFSFMKASLVMVLQLFKVKLTDGFAEFDCPFSPVFNQSNIAWSTHWKLPCSMFENKE